MNKPHINVGSGNACFIFAAVNTGKMKGGATVAGLIEVNPGAVKPTEIVDHTSHEFQWVMGFQVEALVAFHGIGCRMGLGEGITGKGFDLPPDLLRNFLRVAEIPAIFKEFVDDPV
jgi:hypothetical protein